MSPAGRPKKEVVEAALAAFDRLNATACESPVATAAAEVGVDADQLERWIDRRESRASATPSAPAPESIPDAPPSGAAERARALLGVASPTNGDSGADAASGDQSEPFSDERREEVVAFVEACVEPVDKACARLAGVVPPEDKEYRPFDGKLRPGERFIVRTAAPQISKAWESLLGKCSEWPPEKTLLYLAGLLIAPRLVSALATKFGKEKAKTEQEGEEETP